MAVSTVPFPDAEGKKKKGVLPRTLRFDLVLEDSTEESTNEYSYAHLVNDALKGVSLCVITYLYRILCCGRRVLVENVDFYFDRNGHFCVT